MSSEVLPCGCPEHHYGRHCPACHGTGWILPQLPKDSHIKSMRDICRDCADLDQRIFLPNLKAKTKQSRSPK